jgi:predicted amidohydrolase
MQRIAVYQTSAVRGDKAANIRTILRAANAAGALDVDLLVLPEMFLTGYNIGRLAHELAEARDGPSLAEIGEIAGRAHCAIAVGFPERTADGVFNSVAVFDTRGMLVSVYRKMHLFGAEETALFSPGEEIAIAELGGRKVGLAICYDIEFPELPRELKRRGAEIILAPTANMAPHWEVPTTFVRARALENGVTVAYANLCGRENDLHYTGLSAITGPDGVDLARAGPHAAAMLIADLPSGSSLGPLSTQLADMRMDGRCGHT